jgi:hypothetical protein
MHPDCARYRECEGAARLYPQFAPPEDERA